jgi:hypothetical protein
MSILDADPETGKKNPDSKGVRTGAKKLTLLGEAGLPVWGKRGARFCALLDETGRLLISSELPEIYYKINNKFSSQRDR